MIVFEQVSKRYAGGYTALAGVSFEIRHGELIVLSGHSGAGKSTLLKLIPVIERPTAGTVRINGQDVSRMPARAIPYLRRNLGLVLQESRLLYDRSVFDNVMLPLVITGHPPRDAAKRVAAALERVGLAGREREMPAGLSGGEQQRVAIARAIVNRPSILIADEPTAHLDPDYAHEIAELFRSFNSAGVTVVVSTHDATLFAASRPRRLVLHKGLLVEGAE
ncbi:ATP-binding cassette domain-containing protein [Thauera sp. CAU 1555]|jgi:cell division transport system ATP-binding protein|uniref:ATP-binding cassette domain-containing protein n=1 Tax=Thauera sedimentorum TaxID=2767595 RepID=A0ABR9BEL4_9RHOO|nr:ATP-binding cassette domain-containing protein [Thauera sedimentorum]MBC9073539.1 ATP-binding cassette domain-containing protein [Thauera sedimentorum]MBD8504458.1 ATP-binding cassette domain-containing protein [Thauera sedimentorum]